jgi:hypothetical protein
MTCTSRTSRKGSALAAAMLFFVTITIAATALLSISAIHRIQIVRSGIDVRLMIAAEAGIETVRGRFTLIPDIQDDWSALLPTTGWNNIGGPLNINGIDVQVQARPIGGPSVPRARIRSIATANERNRVVEYTIQVASFADYALYFGATNTVSIGSYFKMVGNIYARGSINVHNRPGVEFFGNVQTSGSVMNYPDYNYNFKRGYEANHPIVTIPSAAYGMDPMYNAASDSGTVYYRNTMAITFDGDEFIRTYRHRMSGVGNNYNHNEYEIRTQRLDVPDESVIYISSDYPPAGEDTYAGPNRAPGNNIQPLALSGVLDWARVTVACEHQIDIVDTLSYQSLLDNPDLRRFPNKESAGALGFREMLGVYSDDNIEFEVTAWSALPASQRVDDIAGFDEGHLPLQYTLDGVFMGRNSAARSGGAGTNTGNKELWLTGGIINGDNPTTALAASFGRRNYDTDYRLRETLPPYFLRAYGASANMIRGTWRTYTL